MLHRVVTTSLFCLISVLVRGEERVGKIDDFDGSSALSDHWSASGPITVRRTDVPDGELNGVAGRMVECSTGPASNLLTKAEMPRPAFSDFASIRFRIQVEQASPQEPFVFELQFLSSQRPARLWRKVTVTRGDWHAVSLPLRFFRPSSVASLDWQEVHRLGFRFRQQGQVRVDGIELVATADDASPYLTSTQLAAIAFGPRARLTEAQPFVILTDDPRVDTQRVGMECQQLWQLVKKDFPNLQPPQRAVPVLIFSNETQYRRFWPRFAASFAAQSPPVRSSGYSLLGVAGTFYDERFGSVRPVLIHEACHAVLAPVLGIANTGEWLHEGLANYYQLHWTDQDVHELTSAMVLQGKTRPLGELLHGGRISLRDYAQVTLFTKWLLAEPQRRVQFRRAVDIMRGRVSTDLAPVCEQAFHVSLDELETMWLRWARRQAKRG